LSGIESNNLLAPCLLDAFGPLPLVEPASAGDLADIIRLARSEGEALYPVGGSTALGLGLPPSLPGKAVGSRQLCRVIDYPARDMTITVQAGIRVADLQKLLATENQRLPIDVPQADRATLGGILATNTSGPRRYGFGTLRDYVIGISVVNDEGHEVKAGGRVVKNVAGYDLCKLYVGSLGTLGIITQVTLKLRPRPEDQVLLIVASPEGNLDALLDQLHHTDTRPVVVDLLNGAAVGALNRHPGVALPEAPWVALVGFEDNYPAVKWQMYQLVKELRLTSGLEARAGATAEPLLQALIAFPASLEAGLTFKAALLPSVTGAFCREAAALPERLLLQAHAGNGIVIGHAAPDLTKERAAAMLKKLRALAAAAQGHVTILRCPGAWKDAAFVWGPPRGDVWMMRKVKEQLDPRRLFNPGRFVDGI
jgi:glycolate oxidase FAD binding subunit